MNPIKSSICPACNSCSLTLKYEAAYIYSYQIDDNNPGAKNDDQFFSFLYDSREQISSNQYIECSNCGSKYPYYKS